MNLQTLVDIRPSERKISYHDNIMFIGSCFTENIASRLSDLKFKTDVNPFGILYNPISILNSIEYLDSKKSLTENDLFYENGIWKSFSHHSRFSNTDKETALNNINDRIRFSSNFLRNTDFLFITLGTSYVYEFKKTGSIVSNCHKVLSSNFNHFLLSVDEVYESQYRIIELVKKINPKINFVYTISPVRHLKNGAHENQLSKSVLILAIKKLKEKFPYIGYFPAYEIMLDELRDYRFYEEDMVHPTKIAIDYIWQKFSDCYFEESTRKLSAQIELINKARKHRPLFPESDEFIKFKNNHLTKVCELAQKHPEVDLSDEIEYFSNIH